MGKRQTRKGDKHGVQKAQFTNTVVTWRYGMLCVAVACQLVTLLLSWSTWNVREDPINLPLFPVPQFSMGILLVLSLSIVLVRPHVGVIAHAVVYAAACVLDQTRIQPQVISLIVLMAGCAHAEGLWFARWYLVAMWLWSGLHKFLSAEWWGWGSWVFLKECGITADDWHVYFALAVAAAEVLLGVAAIFWPHRAAPFCVALHLGVLFSLSPLARNYNISVWPWNLATAVVGAWILRQEAAKLVPVWRLGVVAALLVLPAAYYVNLLNPHLAFVLYSGNMPQAYHTSRTNVLELSGWQGMAVPFPDSPGLFLQVFRRKAEPGDKLYIADPRWGQPNRHYVMGQESEVQEISRERFLSAENNEVGGIELAHPSAAWRVSRLGVKLEFDESKLESSATASGPRFDNAAMEELAKLPNLRQVDIEDAPITDHGLMHLQGLSRLEILRIRRCGITDQGLRNLTGLSRLSGLELKQVSITSAGLEVLDGMTGLKVLQLPAARIDDDCLVRIGKLKELEWLDLSETSISGEGLRNLVSLQKCTWINLSGTAVDDLGMKYLGRMSSLQIVELSGTKVSDAGLIHLSQLKHCEHLDLDETNVTDVGLVHLLSLSKLKYLSLRKTHVSESGAAQIQERHPNCQIVR